MNDYINNDIKEILREIKTEIESLQVLNAKKSKNVFI